MKKSLALLLALVVVFSLSVSAFAVSSPKPTPVDPGSAAPLPLVKEETIKLTELEKAEELTEVQQEVYAKAYEDLANVVPEGFIPQYFCYAQASKYPAVAELEISNATEAKAKLYSNGKWTDLVCSVNGNKVSVTLPHEGALAVFTK